MPISDSPTALEKLQEALQRSSMAAMLSQQIRDESYNDDNTAIFKILFARNIDDITSNYLNDTDSSSKADIRKRLYMFANPGLDPQNIPQKDIDEFWRQLGEQLKKNQPFEYLAGEQIAALPQFEDLRAEDVQDIIRKSFDREQCEALHDKMQDQEQKNLKTFSSNILKTWQPDRIAKLYSPEKEFPNNLVLFRLLANNEQKSGTVKNNPVLNELFKDPKQQTKAITRIIDYLDPKVPASTASTASSPKDNLTPKQRTNLLSPLTDVLLSSQRTLNLNAPKISAEDLTAHLQSIIKFNYPEDLESYEIFTKEEMEPKAKEELKKQLKAQNKALQQQIAEKILDDPNAVDIIARLDFESIAKLTESINNEHPNIKRINTIVDAVNKSGLANEDIEKINSKILTKLNNNGNQQENQNILEKIIYSGKNKNPDTIFLFIIQDPKNINIFVPLTNILLGTEKSFFAKKGIKNTPEKFNHILNLVSEDPMNAAKTKALSDIANKILSHPNAEKIVRGLSPDNITKLSEFATDMRQINIVANAVKGKQAEFSKENLDTLNTHFSTNLPNAITSVPPIPQRPRRFKLTSPSTWIPNLIWNAKNLWRKIKNKYRAVVKKQPDLNTLLESVTTATRRQLNISKEEENNILSKIDADGQKYLPFIGVSNNAEKSSPVTENAEKRQHEQMKGKLGEQFQTLAKQYQPPPISQGRPGTAPPTFGSHNLITRKPKEETTTEEPTTKPPEKPPAPTAPTEEPPAETPAPKPQVSAPESDKFPPEIVTSLNTLKNKPLPIEVTDNCITITKEAPDKQAEALAEVIATLAANNLDNKVNLSGFNEETIKATFEKLKDKKRENQNLVNWINNNLSYQESEKEKSVKETFDRLKQNLQDPEPKPKKAPAPN